MGERKIEQETETVVREVMRFAEGQDTTEKATFEAVLDKIMASGLWKTRFPELRDRSRKGRWFGDVMPAVYVLFSFAGPFLITGWRILGFGRCPFSRPGE